MPDAPDWLIPDQDRFDKLLTWIGDDTNQLALLLAQLRQAKRVLGDYETAVTETLYDLIPGKELTVDGVGVLEKKRGTDRKQWQHDELWRLLTAKGRDERLVDEETGEALESEGEAVARVLQEAVGVSYWKVTALRARHIQVDEFCETTKGRPQITIR